MLNDPWMDPRSIDFTDAHNPLARPRWYPHRNPFRYATLNDPLWLGLRNATNLEPRILVAPAPIDQLIAAGATVDQSMSIDPFTWLWGVNCKGSGAGFYFQVTDAVTGATVFSQPVLSQDFAPSDPNGCVVYLAAPRYFVPPSYPIVRIVNNVANAAQLCTVNLFTSIEVMPS